MTSRYRDELFGLLRPRIESEGYKPRVYIDPKGIPTIGKGFALFQQEGDDAKVPGGIKILERDTINRILSANGGTQKSMTLQEWSALKNLESLSIGDRRKRIEELNNQTNDGEDNDVPPVLDLELSIPEANTEFR